MNPRIRLRLSKALCHVFALAFLLPTNQAKDAVSIENTNYHGWDNSLRISNGKVEVIIVPAVGRIMQFRFIGSEGPFWENPALFGHAPDPKSHDWGNFGGDKTWPAPQAEWTKITSRAWPPPVAFDSMPVEARIEDGAVVLTSPVDPHFGIRTKRRIELDKTAPVMRIKTRYEKVDGKPGRVAIWTITQFKDPIAVYAPIPANSRFSEGYVKQSDALPLDLKTSNGMVSVRRSPTGNAKIGTDARALLWVGREVMTLIESPRVSDVEYPDGESSEEIYTNNDPLAYVELEMLGPLRTMKVGDEIEQTNTYTLLPRTRPEPEAEARKVFHLE